MIVGRYERQVLIGELRREFDRQRKKVSVAPNPTSKRVKSDEDSIGLAAIFALIARANEIERLFKPEPHKFAKLAARSAHKAFRTNWTDEVAADRREFTAQEVVDLLAKVGELINDEAARRQFLGEPVITESEADTARIVKAAIKSMLPTNTRERDWKLMLRIADRRRGDTDAKIAAEFKISRQAVTKARHSRGRAAEVWNELRDHVITESIATRRKAA